MRQKSLRRLVGGSAVALLAALSFTASAGAADHRRVVMSDDCEPVSFNFFVPGNPPTCVGQGETTFLDFIQQLKDEAAAEDWAFSRDHFNVDSGGTISVVNEGGEAHTFTQVKAFGGGCVPPVNEALNFNRPGTFVPVEECDGKSPPDVGPRFVASVVPPGATRDFKVTGSGTQMFQCLIHPWMRSVVDVRGKD
jgi:plastocyanin